MMVKGGLTMIGRGPWGCPHLGRRRFEPLQGYRGALGR
jgi:hypothetical protein